MSYEGNLILARLAAERARLLRELIGVDTQTLETVPVFTDWTAANLLAHIGDYDALFVERFQMVLQGKEGEIDSIGDDSTPDNRLGKRNANIQARVKSWGLQRSLTFFNSSRAAFLQVLAQVSDKELKRVRQMAGGETSLYLWTRWRWEHDEHHAQDLRRWGKTLRRADVPGSKEVLMAALQAAMDDFLASTALIPPLEQETRPVCGTWTLKDVCGHMADCDAYYNSQARMMLGLDFEPMSADAYSEAANEQLAAARRSQSWNEVMNDFVKNSLQLWDTISQASEYAINRPYSGGKTTYRTVYHCIWSALEHYLDHAAITRRELPVKAMPKRLWTFEGPYT